MMRSSPALPDLLFCDPAWPESARKIFLKRKSTSVPTLGVASRNTSPQRPPSPPAGPPFGTYFSRRHAMMPSPPLPASSVIAASSMNCICAENQKESRAALFRGACVVAGASAGRDDVDMLAVPRGGEADLTLDDREDRVVLAHHDADAGIELRPALADDDVARHDRLAAEALHTQTLRVRVAPVPRGTGTFFGREQLQIELEHNW